MQREWGDLILVGFLSAQREIRGNKYNNPLEPGMAYSFGQILEDAGLSLTIYG